MTGPAPNDAAAVHPKVFLSYAHDDEFHKSAVLDLATFLVEHGGVDLELDVWRTDRRQDWFAWALHHIKESDFVIVVASPRYREVGDGTASSDQHRGVQAEAAALRECLYADRERWVGRILPVVLPDRAIEDLPTFVQPFTASHYVVDSITDVGLEELLRVLTRQPRHVRPKLGAVPVLASQLAPRPATQPLVWRPLPEPTQVHWRADLLDSRGMEPPRATIEVHLVPTAVTSLVSVRRLELLAEELAGLGRSRGFFNLTQELRTGSSNHEAGAFVVGREGWRGLAVHRDGQRSVWWSLPSARVGSAFNRDDVATQMAAQLDLLMEISLDAPVAVAPVAAIDPVGMLRRGAVADLSSLSASFRMDLPRQVRLTADESVEFVALREATDEMAQELTTRLATLLRLR